MLSRPIINRFLVLCFMVLIGYCLAKSIKYQSTIGVILALVSLGAGIYFLYLLGKARQEMETEETA